MATIHVVGLGPGDITGMPLGTFRLLESGLPLFLRTEVHPVVPELRERGVTYKSFDILYEQMESFDEVYREIAAQLIAEAEENGTLVYAVPGHPLMAERSVQNLLTMAETVDVQVGSGQSFLDPVCTRLRIDPVEGLLLLDATDLRADLLSPQMHTLVVQVFSPAVAADVKLTLMEVYPDDHPVTVVRAAGVVSLEKVETHPLFELDRIDWIDHLTTIYLPKGESLAACRKDPWYAISLVRQLRAPDGCPWDRKQTHQTLRKYVIEEAYEVADAIDRDEPGLLVEELGDLLLQVLLHSQIGSETGDFDVRDVCAALSDKLVRRHPHVFGDAAARTTEEVEGIWRAVKQREKGVTEDTQSLMDPVRWGHPAWRIAQDLQERAAQVGFDWENVEQVLAKVREEVNEVHSAVRDDHEYVFDEVGDLAFTLVNLTRWLKLDLEEVLSSAARKFDRRFRFVEQLVTKQGGNWGDLSQSELDALWEQAKLQTAKTL